MRRSSRPITIAALLVAVLAGAPAPASATSPAVARIYDDCGDGVLDKRYTDAQLNAALRDIEANTGEYSECADAIVGAQLGLTGAAAKDAKAARDAAGAKAAAGGSSAKGGESQGGGTPGAGDTTAGDAAGDAAASGGDPAAPSLTDGRGASESEKVAAAAAATAAADGGVSPDAARLLGAAVPAAAVEMGATRIAMPLPAVITVGLCALLGVLAGVATLVTRLTRPRL